MSDRILASGATERVQVVGKSARKQQRATSDEEASESRKTPRKVVAASHRSVARTRLDEANLGEALGTASLAAASLAAARHPAAASALNTSKVMTAGHRRVVRTKLDEADLGEALSTASLAGASLAAARHPAAASALHRGGGAMDPEIFAAAVTAATATKIAAPLSSKGKTKAAMVNPSPPPASSGPRRRTKRTSGDSGTAGDNADDAPPPAAVPAGFGGLLARYPLLVNALQAGVLGGLSNLTSQWLRGAGWAAGGGLASVDCAAVCRFALVPALVMTPVSSYWFAALSRLELAKSAQVALDALVGALVLNATFVSALLALEGRGAEIGATLCSSKFLVNVVLGSNKVWLPAKIVMFCFVPPLYWQAWCSAVSFVWQVMLAAMV